MPKPLRRAKKHCGSVWCASYRTASRREDQRLRRRSADGRCWRMVRVCGVRPSVPMVRMGYASISRMLSCRKGEIRVFDTEDPTVVRGPYNSVSMRNREAFWSGALFAQTVTVECWVPRGSDPTRAAFSIGKVVHLYRTPGTIRLKEGNCHNDVSCYPGWDAASRGVAGIGVFYEANYLYCTGCLLNDLDDSTWVDFFLTGTHCVANQSQASDTEFYWFFQTATCNGAPPSLAADRHGGWIISRDRPTRRAMTLRCCVCVSSPDGATMSGGRRAGRRIPKRSPVSITQTALQTNQFQQAGRD